MVSFLLLTVPPAVPALASAPPVPTETNETPEAVPLDFVILVDESC